MIIWKIYLSTLLNEMAKQLEHTAPRFWLLIVVLHWKKPEIPGKMAYFRCGPEKTEMSLRWVVPESKAVCRDIKRIQEPTEEDFMGNLIIIWALETTLIICSKFNCKNPKFIVIYKVGKGGWRNERVWERNGGAERENSSFT